jgi:hypothetical protein
MSKTSTILLAAVGLLAYSLYRKQSALNTLQFYPYSLKGIKFDGITPVMTMGLAVQNTSNQNFTLNSFAGQLYANTYLIGNVGSFIPQNILANNQSVIYIDVRLSLLNIVSDIISAINNNSLNQTFELDSTANIDNLQIPVKVKFTFKQ